MNAQMKTLASAMALLVAACGGVEADDEDVGQTDEALSASAFSYVSIRHDARRCASPMCGGYWAKDLKTGTETYVNGLDFSKSNLDEDARGDVTSAGDGEVILRAKLGKAEARSGTRPLILTEAWRGLPGQAITRGDKLYFAGPRTPHIECFAAPCPNLTAKLIPAGTKTNFDGLDVSPSGAADDAWLTDRVLSHGALVAAHFTAGQQFPAGREKILSASQVFLKLPERAGPCPMFRLAACPTGQVWSYTRNELRCAMPQSCVPERTCRRGAMAHCPEGYTLQTWSQDGCPAFACDPTWSIEEAP